MNLHPFNVILAEVVKIINQGGTIHQQFVCAFCGSKQTMSEANKMFTEGLCEECGELTDIKKNGCNFLVIFSR